VNSRRHYDVAVIGAGLSGLAAAVRAAHFGKSVCVFERHNAPGGLNGFYSHGGRKFDAGLHAVTNFVPAGIRGTPLGRLLRQLRLDRDQLALREQNGSRVAFGPAGEASLRFTNQFAVLESEVARVFPRQIDGFRRLAQRVRESAFEPDAPLVSARQVMGGFLTDPLCVEMLLCPLMFYGCPNERDFSFGQMAVLFQAIYLEGFARPAEGIRLILRLLLDKYREAGGERRMKCGVKRIVAEQGRAAALVLDDDTEITADHIISSIGGPETAALVQAGSSTVPASPALEAFREQAVGTVSYVETMTVFDRQPAEFGWEETIVFFNDSADFHYESPTEAVDPRSGVICFPNNFHFTAEELPAEGMMRVTCLANYERWTTGLSPEAYAAQKSEWFDRVQGSARRFLPRVDPAAFAASCRATDMFTPRTIERFTGHRNGAIYGSPGKSFRGLTPLSNLYLCGTDQGLLGIIGSMLSGITMANQRVLAPA
jgi:phytoene dehydrogenase-like protein